MENKKDENQLDIIFSTSLIGNSKNVLIAWNNGKENCFFALKSEDKLQLLEIKRDLFNCLHYLCRKNAP